jgi:hypothetical protein
MPHLHQTKRGIMNKKGVNFITLNFVPLKPEQDIHNWGSKVNTYGFYTFTKYGKEREKANKSTDKN